MEKLLTQFSNCNDLENESAFDFSFMPSKALLTLEEHQSPKTLSACVSYLNNLNDIEQNLSGNFVFGNVVLNEELFNKKVRYIAEELAAAIDSNCVWKIKKLKKEYGYEEEFIKAKKFLNKKCKEVWNVYKTTDKILNVPQEAMKTLGITNHPDLETILGNSVKYYEKDGGNSTAGIINLILNNKNLDYTMKDIHQFLKNKYKTERCHYNFYTTRYLIVQHKYNNEELYDLGIEKSTIEKVFQELSLFEKCKFIFINLKNVKIFNI